MKKRSTRKVPGVAQIAGLDVGDRWTYVYVVEGESGEVVDQGRVRTTLEALRRRFEGPRMRIALEVGPHSPWMSRLLEELGHEVLVANAREVALVYASRRKGDRVDAESLARLARLDPRLLRAISHRSEQAQADRAVLKARDLLVRSRSGLIAHVRGTVKAMGGTLPRCSVECFVARSWELLPELLRPALEPVLRQIDSLTESIRSYDHQLEQMAEERYAESALLRQVDGVGLVTSLAYVLQLEDPRRFRRSRTVGAYFGLVPQRAQSGDRDPQLRISKRGDPFVRRLLIQCARHILGPFGKDSELRRYGLRIAERGGKNAKKRAAVAVARKLAVLLHRLWLHAEVYEPFYTMSDREQAA